MNLEKWAARQLRVVEEDGTVTARIRLVCVTDGSQLEVWEGEELQQPAADWTAQALSLLTEMQEDWPTKPISLLFIAEDKNGSQRSSCPLVRHGKNRDASPDLMKGRDIKAITDSMEAIAKTNDRVLATANGQLDRMNTALQTMTEHHMSTLEFVREKLQHEALTVAQQTQTTDKVMQLIEQFGPMLAEVLQAKMKTPAGKMVAGAAVNAAAKAVAKPAPAAATNGHSAAAIPVTEPEIVDP